MKQRTIRFRGYSVILRPDKLDDRVDEARSKRLGRRPRSPQRLRMINVEVGGEAVPVSMPRGAVEKLRDALSDWLESGDQ